MVCQVSATPLVVHIMGGATEFTEASAKASPYGRFPAFLSWVGGGLRHRLKKGPLNLH